MVMTAPRTTIAEPGAGHGPMVRSETIAKQAPRDKTARRFPRAVPEVSRAEFKRAGLRRMRAIALGLLLLMTAIFIATTAFRSAAPWVPYLRAFAEAAMVGACADWFAVVALFRRPLGLPIPHTGIVAANQERIAVALGRFISENFLDPREAHRQLARIDLLGALTRWLNEPGRADALAGQIAGQLPRLARMVPTTAIGEALGQIVRRGIEAAPAAPLAAKTLGVLWAGGAAQPVLEQAIVLGERALDRHKTTITRLVSEQSGRWIPRWVDRMIAEKVTSGLLSTLRELRDPAHPWRLELSEAVERLIDDLASDPNSQAIGERIKAEILASPLVAEQARALWAELERGIRSGSDARRDAIVAVIASGLRALGRQLEEDSESRNRLNRALRLAALRALLPQREQIGTYVTQVVQGWDSATLVERLELQVGKDLQYIRINGTVVGGLVGLVIFATSQWLAP